MSTEFKETCPAGINAQLPGLWQLIWRRRRWHVGIKVCLFGLFLLSSQWQHPNWLWIAGFLVLLLATEIGTWRLIAWTTIPFVRQGANDWVECTAAGEICVYRNGRKALALTLLECRWADVPDLRELSKYNDFPQIHLFVVARWTRPAFWQKAPLIVCGFTDATRERWQKIFVEAGVEQQMRK